MRAAQATAGSGPSPAIRVDAVTKVFRTGILRRPVPALQQVSFAMAAGEVVGILGPNGSGKTTLLDMLIGFQRPDRGTVWVFGAPAGARAGLQRTGHQPQAELPYQNLGARAFLRFLAGARGMAAVQAHERIEELLERLDLRGAARRPIASYSTGMRRRLAFAQAVLHRPDLLLLDEPTSGLDPVGSATISEMLAVEAARGVTILMASHHLHEVERLCHRVLLLVAGRLAADGPLQSLCATGDRLALAVRDLTPAAFAELQRRAAELGGTVDAAGPGLLELDALYRRLLSTPEPGENP